jgi:outer membrane receptor for ferrienterochelin and colicin
MAYYNKFKKNADRLSSVSLGVMAMVALLPGQLLAQEIERIGAESQSAGAALDNNQVEDIIVTGYRESLQSALNVKRQSVASVDAIVAEDIAKFPDQNLAESLQRVPGISIQRDGGEGRAITVRGLGAQFTRVRVNGLETVATSSDGFNRLRKKALSLSPLR